MKAEIISIGSELTSGRNLDTNARWLSLRLGEIGIPVAFHTTIADDLDDNVAAFRLASERADVVLTTGGLGPTQDDLTREVMARVGGVELVFDEPSYEAIRGMFARRNRVMPERNRVQAMVPAGAEVLPNACGTAPGVGMKLGRAWFAAMPGVPSEMYAMYEAQVRPRLVAMGLAGGVFVQRKINTFGMGESQVEEKLLDLTARGHIPEVGITASDATISLRIFAMGPDLAAVNALIEPVERTIRERLGVLVFGDDEDELQDAVVRLLAEKRKTFAVAEGVTGGLLGQRLAGVPGATQWFRGGVIAYTDEATRDLLGVPAELLREHGAVSEQVAVAMAKGCRERLGTDLAVSTVGVAGPGGGSDVHPVGTVFAALAHAGGVSTQTFSWLGTRAEVQSRTAKLALNLARLYLLRGG
jgi:nicotinamide-nucleotide amidase